MNRVSDEAGAGGHGGGICGARGDDVELGQSGQGVSAVYSRCSNLAKALGWPIYELGLGARGASERKRPSPALERVVEDERATGAGNVLHSRPSVLLGGAADRAQRRGPGREGGGNGVRSAS
ncbi:MAG TPA: hypothetical protein VKG38_19290 [Solirubrobacteraceae bacterium]|nr:hypothetical protein [Solirubrobacteraceae bacterium]